MGQSTANHTIALRKAAYPCTAQHDKAGCGMAQHSPAQHRTAQHSIAKQYAKHSTAQYGKENMQSSRARQCTAGQQTWRVAARADSTTCSVGANSSWKTAASWKKSEQKRYSEVAVSISNLFTLRNNSCKPSTFIYKVIMHIGRRREGTVSWVPERMCLNA